MDISEALSRLLPSSLKPLALIIGRTFLVPASSVHLLKSRRPSMPIKLPLRTYSPAISAWRPQISISNQSVSLSFVGRFTARLNVVLTRPDSKYLISGSRPARPTSITELTISLPLKLKAAVSDVSSPRSATSRKLQAKACIQGFCPIVLWLTIIIPSDAAKISRKLAPYRRLIAITSATEKTEEIAHLQESRRQPVWHVIVLFILTLGAYWPFWFAKNWSLLIHAHKLANGEEGADERLVAYTGNAELVAVQNKDPILLTIGMFIPFFDLYLAFRQFNLIARLEPDKTTLHAQHPRIAATLLLLSMIGLSTLFVLPQTLYLFYLTSCAPLAIAQHWLNQYWKQHEPPDSLVRQAFSSIELLCVIFGSLWLGLIVIRPFVVH